MLLLLKVVLVVHLSCICVLSGLGDLRSPPSGDSIDEEVTQSYPANAPLSLVQSRIRYVTRHLRDTWKQVATVSPELLRMHKARQRLKQARILQIILDVKDMTGINNTLGFTRTPMTHGLEAFQSRLLESRRLAQQQNDADDNKRMMHSILLPSCQPTDSENSGSAKALRLFFNIAPSERLLKPESIIVKSAALLLKRRPLQNLQSSRNWKVTDDQKLRKRNRKYSTDAADVWKVRIHSYNRSKKGGKKALKSVSLNPYNSTEWLKIGVLKIVEDWYRTPVVKSAGLQVTVVDGRGKPIDPFQVFYDFGCDFPVPSPGSGESERSAKGDDRQDKEIKLITNFPHLEVVTMAIPSTGSRSQRHLVKKRKACKKRVVHVRVSDLGPSLAQTIIAPYEFKSAVCEGRCRRCRKPKPLTGLANMTQVVLGQRGTDSCCRPTETKSIDALYLDENGVVTFRQLPDAIVTKCGCSRRDP